MSTVRRPRVLPTPSLADLVTDLDSQIPEGDGPVELPAETWGQLADQASRELARHVERNVNELEDLRKFRARVRDLVAAPTREQVLGKQESDERTLELLEAVLVEFRKGQLSAMLKADGPGPAPSHGKHPPKFDAPPALSDFPEPEPFDPLPPPKKKRKSKAEAQREAIERAGGFHCDDCAAFCKLERPGTWDGRKQCQACRKLFDDAASATPPKQEEVPF